jgi:polar amino acid transport system substrate-binding protein
MTIQNATGLLPAGKLRVAIAISAAPGAFWASRDPSSGEPRGVSVDLAKAFAAELGVPLQLVVYENSSSITAAAAKGEWDATFIPMDDDRAKKIDFGPVYNVAESTFLVRAGSSLASVAEVDRPGVRIVAVADTTTMRACEAWARQTRVTGFATVDEIVKKLKAGEMDAFAMSRDGLTALAAEIPGSRVLPGQFFGAKTAVATPQGRAELLARVGAFLQAAKSNGTVRRIFDANGMAGSPVAD